MVAVLVLDEGIVAAKVIGSSFNQQAFMEYLCDDMVSQIYSFGCLLKLNSCSFLGQHHILDKGSSYWVGHRSSG
jgi:hypothetical protein